MERVQLSVGDVIAARYKLERIIGQGGMGVVFAAVDCELERRVAVKLLLPERIESEEKVQRFLREAKAAARLRSEHVTQVYDTGRLPSGLPFIVMEFLSGRDLATRMAADGTFSIAEAARCMLQACEALAQAHAAGIVHRDLKPANLFLARHADGSDVLKVLDFGISKFGSGMATGPGANLTKSAAIIGSPFYMSPEQLEHPSDVDHRTDIWALGVIAYELLAGKRPFNGETMPGLCVAIIHSEPVPVANHRSDIPPALARTIDRCLVKDRSRRVQNVGELANAFAPFDVDMGRNLAERIVRILETDPVPSDSINQVLSEKGSERRANWANTQRQREHKRGLFAVCGVLLLSGIAAAFYLAFREPGPKPAHDAAAAIPFRSAAATPLAVEPDSGARAAASATVAPIEPAPVSSSAPAPSSSAPPKPKALKPEPTKAVPVTDPFRRRH